MRTKTSFRMVTSILAVAVASSMLASSALASTYKTLFVFNGKDGSYPNNYLTFDAAGNLYGATCRGGPSGNGLVFKLSPNPNGRWTGSAPHVFSGSDGSCPLGALIFDAAGNLYGATNGGGAYGAGTVFELKPNSNGTWTESVLYSFTGGSDGSAPNPLIFGPNGVLYGTVIYGAASGYWGGVFELTPNSNGTWLESGLYSFTGGSDGGHPVGALVFDAAGNLYGTAYWGGSAKCENGCGTAFKLAPNQDGSWTESVLHEFTAGSDGANPGGNLIFDAAGNLYGASDWGGLEGNCTSNKCGAVFQLTPNLDGTWTTNILHTFTGKKDGGGAGGGCGVAFDTEGNLYGTRVWGGPYGYGLVYKLMPMPNGTWSETGLGFNDHPAGNPDGGVILDAAGNLYGTTAGDGSTTFGTAWEITP